MLNVRGQQHSFSTHKRVFSWKFQSFWDRKCLDLRGTRTPNLRLHIYLHHAFWDVNLKEWISWRCLCPQSLGWEEKHPPHQLAHSLPTRTFHFTYLANIVTKKNNNHFSIYNENANHFSRMYSRFCCCFRPVYFCPYPLYPLYWCQDKMTAIFQMKFSNAF